MPRRTHLVCALAPTVVLGLLMPGGCNRDQAPAAPAPAASAVKEVELEKNVLLEVQGKQRRAIVKAVVCLRDGELEGLLTRTKEHEYVLAADCDARKAHLALEVALGKPGAPVTLEPAYRAAHGPSVQVSLRYKKDGKTVTVPARDWVREVNGKRPLNVNWVFAGSRFLPNPDGKRAPIYAANQGDLICLCNMETALLDLPVPSPKSMGSRTYEANTERIPAVGTAVEVIFEPTARKGAAR